MLGAPVQGFRQILAARHGLWEGCRCGLRRRSTEAREGFTSGGAVP